jgi:prepilin-type N-terminal cleavage/methylation domain-containing protein
LKKKSAFSLIELVFVIVVLGILASLAMSRSERDLRQEASETILSHIRLAQQLALRDNKHRPFDGTNNDDRWQRAYWRFEYANCSDMENYDGTASLHYRVGSSIDLGANIDKAESAINPINGKYLYTFHTCNDLEDDESPEVLLSEKFGVRKIEMDTNSGCGIAVGSSTAKQIAFDYLGRPHRGVNAYNTPQFQKLMIEDCNITFTMSTDQNSDGNDDSFIITIKKETGHAFIIDQEEL